jgi:hypothetical protein
MSALDLDGLASWALPLLMLRATALLLLIAGSVTLLRRASASVRHALLVLGTLGLLALPLVSGGLPAIEVALLPVHETVTTGPMRAPAEAPVAPAAAPISAVRSPAEVTRAPLRSSARSPALLEIEVGLPAGEPVSAVAAPPVV